MKYIKMHKSCNQRDRRSTKLVGFMTDRFAIHEMRYRENGFAADILKLRANISCIGSSGGFSYKGGYPRGVKRNRNGENIEGSQLL